MNNQPVYAMQLVIGDGGEEKRVTPSDRDANLLGSGPCPRPCVVSYRVVCRAAVH